MTAEYEISSACMATFWLQDWICGKKVWKHRFSAGRGKRVIDFRFKCWHLEYLYISLKALKNLKLLSHRQGGWAGYWLHFLEIHGYVREKKLKHKAIRPGLIKDRHTEIEGGGLVNKAKQVLRLQHRSVNSLPSGKLWQTDRRNNRGFKLDFE